MRTGVLFFSRENDMVPLSAGVVRTDLGIVPTFWDTKKSPLSDNKPPSGDNAH